MPEQRMARVFAWEPAQDDDLIYIEPRGRALVYGDAVIVNSNQSVRFMAAGREQWFRDVGHYTVGYDSRSEEEILRANLAGEDLGELPMLIHTSIVFCSLKSRVYTCATPSYIKINQMVRLKPAFRMTIRIVDEQQLLNTAELDQPVFRQVLNAACTQLIARIETILQEAGAFDVYTIEEKVKEQFANPEWTQDVLDEIKNAVQERTYFGVKIERVELIDWGIRSGFCSVCGEPVNRNDSVCPNRHILHRCPVCHELLYNGRCLTNGHLILFCQECGVYMAADKETKSCPVHRHVRIY